MVTHIDLRLSPNSEAGSAARHSLDPLEDGLPPQKLEDVRLVVSELVPTAFAMPGSHPTNASHLR